MNEEETNTDLLTKEESYMILFFIAQAKHHQQLDMALNKLGYSKLSEVYNLAPHITTWNIQAGSFSEVKSKLGQRINGNKALKIDLLADDIYEKCKNYKYEDFNSYIEKFLTIKKRLNL